MTFGLSAVCLIVAVVLFILSAVPPVPYSATLARVGLAFFAAAFLVAGVG